MKGRKRRRRRSIAYLGSLAHHRTVVEECPKQRDLGLQALHLVRGGACSCPRLGLRRRGRDPRSGSGSIIPAGDSGCTLEAAAESSLLKRERGLVVGGLQTCIRHAIGLQAPSDCKHPMSTGTKWGSTLRMGMGM